MVQMTAPRCMDFGPDGQQCRDEPRQRRNPSHRRPLLPRRPDRTRRHGRGLAGRGPDARSRGRPQEGRHDARRLRARPGPRRARGPARGPAEPPAHRGDLRPRRRGRRPLAGHGVRPGPHPEPARRRGGAARPRGGARRAGAGRRRPGRRPQRRHPPPRREALEHPDPPRRQREAHRLRHRARDRRRHLDPDRARHRLAGLPRARGRLGRTGVVRQRRLGARRHALPRARGTPALRHGRQRHGGDVPDRARPRAAQRPGRDVDRAARAHAGEGPREPLDHGPGAQRPAGPPSPRRGDHRRRDGRDRARGTHPGGPGCCARLVVGQPGHRAAPSRGRRRGLRGRAGVDHRGHRHLAARAPDPSLPSSRPRRSDATGPRAGAAASSSGRSWRPWSSSPWSASA